MEIFKYYHFLNPKDYPNLGLDIYINIFYFCLFILTVAVMVFLHFQRRELFRFFTALSRHEAKDEATAKTIEGLRLKNGLLLRYILKYDNRIKRLVGVTGEKKYTYEEYMELLKKKKQGKKSATSAAANSEANSNDAGNANSGANGNANASGNTSANSNANASGNTSTNGNTNADTPDEELKYYLRAGEEEAQNRIIETYEPSVVKTILFITLIFMITVCLILVSPEMLELLNSWLG